MFDTDKKRMLALDGGGILGVMSLGALRQIETQLRKHTGKPDLLLCDFFDYFAGTSTGAIIAAGLALGKTVDEIERIYLEEGDDIFDRHGFLTRSFGRFRSKFSHEKLTRRLKQEFSDKSILQLRQEGRLGDGKHLLVVTRNLETDSPWPISTNPRAKYNDEHRPDCNLRIPLWQLVRSSTAAPTYFAPERLQWDPADPDKQFYFEDGGTTPYNNPSFILYKMATAPEYKLEWPTGEDKMMLISVGTGYSYRLLPNPNAGGESILETAASLPAEMMRAVAMENDMSCRTIGRCVAGPQLDREIGDMIPPAGTQTDRKFLYARYDIETSPEKLHALGLGDIDTGKLAMDNPAAAPDMKRIGEKLGEQVDLAAQFPGFLS